MDSEEKKLLAQMPQTERPRFRAKSISSVLNRVIAERGYAAEQANQLLAEHWANAVGPTLREQTRLGKIRAGVLQVYASNHIVLSELEFMKPQILAELQRTLPQFRVTKIRYFVSS